MRTNRAHDWLHRLESQVRSFIDEKMTEQYGTQWPYHQLPNGMYQRWKEKKQRAEGAGRPIYPLIAYADFMDYAQIICRSDNWERVFRHHFKRKENIRESFQRLHPIRLDTMHSRLVSQRDKLLLYVETDRLVQAMEN